MPYRPANTSVFGGGHPAGPAAGRPTYLGATTRARTEGQAAEDRRWVHDQLFVLNVTFAALNEYGGQGWERVGVAGYPGKSVEGSILVLFFKRPVG